MTEKAFRFPNIPRTIMGLGERLLAESKLAAILMTNTKARKVFEETTGLTVQEWAQQIRESAGIPPEIVAK
jgi:methylphosphotriester-DNA--protein-cysteine methyltransferase